MSTLHVRPRGPVQQVMLFLHLSFPPFPFPSETLTPSFDSLLCCVFLGALDRQYPGAGKTLQQRFFLNLNSGVPFSPTFALKALHRADRALGLANNSCFVCNTFFSLFKDQHNYQNPAFFFFPFCCCTCQATSRNALPQPHSSGDMLCLCCVLYCNNVQLYELDRWITVLYSVACTVTSPLCETVYVPMYTSNTAVPLKRSLG